LREDHSAWRIPRDTGSSALPVRSENRSPLRQQQMGVPSGRVPTTHILKPPTGEFDGHAENEHFCLSWHALAGFPSWIPESCTSGRGRHRRRAL